MTRIDFYVIPEAEDPGPVPLCCRLCEKSMKSGLKTYVWAPDGSLIDDVDAALWTFRQGSFVAHEYAERCEDTDLTPVLLGRGEPPESHHGVLINLGGEVPDFFSRFERLLEIVCGDARARADSRKRFQFYRDRGYALETHKL